MHRIALPTIAASLAAGVASASVPAPDRPRVGLIVETTRGPAPAAVAAAQDDVARLRAGGVEAELRVTRSPTESVGAAATLATRGARTIVTREVDAGRLAPVRRRWPGLRVAAR